MRWQRFFDDLEAQWARADEASAASIDAETRRARTAQTQLVDRLRALTDTARTIVVSVGDRRFDGTVVGVGADWLAVSGSDGVALVPLSAVDAFAGALPEASAAPPSPLASRVTFGYLLRDLARRRAPVRVLTVRGDTLHGTVDRAGVDHLDLALHDGAARRRDDVTGVRVLPFSATAAVIPDEAARLPFS